jgi:hypothetical protein
MSKNKKEDEIRTCGPGKFNTILDSYIYTTSLDGCDDEAGSGQDQWVGLLRGPIPCKGSDMDVWAAARIDGWDLNAAEIRQLNECEGIIIREDSSGFVDVEYYDTARELELAWVLIQACEIEWHLDPANTTESD